MKKCNSCNIYFNTSDKYCPLCQNILIGNNDDILFPKNVRYHTSSLILKIVLFVSLVTILISVFLEIIIKSNINISLYIGLGLLTNYIVVYYILKNYQNIYRMFGRYGFVLIFLLLIWYAFTKSKVITNYIIPIACIIELLFNLIVGIILRKNYLIKYSGQILMNIFLLLVPMVLVCLKLTSNNIMSYICCMFSIIAILGLFIFFFKDIKEELKKIFNL